MIDQNLEAAVVYSVASATDIAEMAQFLGDCFSRREPPAVAAGFPADKIAELVRALCSSPVTTGLSAVARDTGSGKLVGAVLASDFAVPPPEAVEPLVPTFIPLFAFLEQLDGQYSAIRQIEDGRCLHLFMIGTADDRTGQGIAGSLLRTCLTNGQERGYLSAVAEATSKASKALFGKHGFRELFFARYEEFEMDGKRPFQYIKDHQGCALMEAKIAIDG